MLKRLLIKNFILIDEASLKFENGLTILSGESGSGKSALLDALSLLFGKKADQSFIREGAEKAVVEASFEVDSNDIFSLCEESGVSLDPEELVTIRREIIRDGKNRSFINSQAVSLPLLQKLAPKLFDLLSQHGQQELKQLAYQRNFLDRFGDLEELVASFQVLFESEKVLENRRLELKKTHLEKTKESDYLTFVVNEIDSLGLKEGEEEALFQEYSTLSHSSEIIEGLNSFSNEMTESSDSILSRLRSWQSKIEKLSTYSNHLANLLRAFSESFSALRETEQELAHLLPLLESDPLRLEFLEKRLSQIDKFKKKYGTSYQEIESTKTEAVTRLKFLLAIEDEIKEVEVRLENAREMTKQVSCLISMKRKEVAPLLSSRITDLLRKLNMKEAKVSVEISPAPRSSSGDDEVSFILAANVGESAVPVASRSSGGELCRLMLALKAILLEKNETETIFFDEIDANVGGETATKMGEILRMLGKYRQVICITHFPQVAHFADHHFCISKTELNGRTLAHIEKLSLKGKEKELLRMLGGTIPSLA